VELHFDAAVFVAVDFFALGPVTTALWLPRMRFGMVQRWAVEHVPRRGEKTVAVALVEIVLGGVAGDGFFEDLGLFAFVEDFGEQPQVVPGFARVVGQWQEVAADQRGLVAPAFGLLVVGCGGVRGRVG
jgi:hypothetical protein